MRKGYKICLGVITILLLITITIGTSYSYYSVSDVQSGNNTMATTCFKVSFTDQNPITLPTAYPISEAKALQQTPYQFTITNTCTTANSSGDIKYDVLLNTLNSPVSTLTEHLNYKLVEVGQTAPASAKVNAVSYTLPSSVKTEKNIDKSYKLGSGTLAPGAPSAPGSTKTYQLYLWIDENTELSNVKIDETTMKSFTGSVLVYSYI